MYNLESKSVMPAYGATKSYVLQLSQSLQVNKPLNRSTITNELQNQFPYEYSGILFHAFHPQFISSALTDGTGWHRMAQAFVPMQSVFPTGRLEIFDCSVLEFSITNTYDLFKADQWAKTALKSVGHGGHSPGWLLHEPLIWCQAYLGSFQVKTLNNLFQFLYWMASIEKSGQLRKSIKMMSDLRTRLLKKKTRSFSVF